jgi:two-component system, NarL family, response regulator YdfI
MTRVFLIAESRRALERLENALEAADFEIAGTTSHFEHLLGVIPEGVDVTVADAGDGPPGEALQTIEESGLLRATRVALLTDEAAPVWVRQALHAGVRGVFPAEVSVQQLRAALAAIAHGLVVLYPSGLFAEHKTEAPPDSFGLAMEPLTPREQEVLQMLGQGKSNKEIAGGLKISEHTVKFHVASILGKLGVSTRTEAVSLAMRRGLILL